MQASSFLAAQSRPSDTAANSIFTADMSTEITMILVCNTTGSAANFSLYHDDNGTTFDQSTALYYQKSVAANDTFIFKAESLNQLTVSEGGQIAVQSSAASALTFSIYAITTTVRGQ